MNNTKQLMLACHMYLGDNEDKFPNSCHGSGVAQGFWVTGWLDWGNRQDNANVQYLLDPQYSVLASYFSNAHRTTNSAPLNGALDGRSACEAFPGTSAWAFAETTQAVRLLGKHATMKRK